MSQSNPTSADLLAHLPWVRALALELVRDRDEAEDVAQETLLRALQHPPREPGAWRGFLRRVLENTRWEGHRRGERRERCERQAARAEAVASAAELVERLAAHRRLVEAVERLSEPHRSAVLLRFFEELPPRAIAARLGVPVKTIDSRLQRALERLRADLDAHAGSRRSWALAVLALVRSSEPLEPSADPAPRLSRFAFACTTLAVTAALGTLAHLWTQSERSSERQIVAAAPVISMEEGPAPPAEQSELATLDREALSLDTDRRVSGRVVAPDGSPIAGARIEASQDPFAGFDVRVREFARAERVLASTTSDREGAFVLAVPTEGPLRLRASAPGLGAEEREHAFAGDAVELVLEDASRFEIQVWRAGEACAQAELELYRQGCAKPQWSGATDERGRASAAALTRGIYTLACSPRDATRTFALDVALLPGQSVPIELRTELGRTVRGCVRDAWNGRPIAAARVSSARTAAVLADTEGRFRVQGLPGDASSWTLCIGADGYGSIEHQLDPSAAAEELAVELEPDCFLTGSVVSEGGAPLSGTWIACGERGARSDSQGRFAIRGLARGRPAIVLVRAQGHGTWRGLLAHGVEGERLDVGRVVLSSSMRLRGIVRTSAGRPVAGASIEVQSLEPPAALGTAQPELHSIAGDATTLVTHALPTVPAGSVDRRLEIELERCGARRSRSSAGGTFRIEDLPRGRYRVLARQNGFEPTPPQTIELVPGRRDPPLELVLEEGLTISGTVRGPDGRPLANAWLLVREDDLALGGPATLSDLDGSFTLRGLSSGPIDLDVSFHGAPIDGEPSYLDGRIHGLVPPVAALEVILPRDLGIEGVLVDEAGDLLAGFTVQSADGEGRKLSSSTDHEGRFRVGAAEGRNVDLFVGRPSIGTGATNATAELRYSGELRAIPAGSRDVVLRATKTL